MKALKITVLLLIGYSLIGCGASKVPTTTGSQASNNYSNIGSKQYADCSGFQKSSVTTQGVVSTFVVNGSSYAQDLIRLKLTQLNTNVTTTDTNYIQIFRWSESNGARQYNTTPVSIVVQLKSSGAYLNSSSPWDRISKANIDSIISSQGLSSSGITTANFASNVIFILQGMDMQYQAMAMAFYNSSVGTTAYDSIDVLLPAFDANPNTYAASRSTNSALPALHPNWASRTSNLTNQQYKDATANYCLQF